MYRHVLKYRLSHHSRQRYADRCIPLDPLGGESEDEGRALFQGGTLVRHHGLVGRTGEGIY